LVWQISEAAQVFPQRADGKEEQQADEAVDNEPHGGFRFEQSYGVNDGDEQRDGEGEHEATEVAGVSEAARKQAEDHFACGEYGHHGTGLVFEQRETARAGGQLRLEKQYKADAEQKGVDEIGDDSGECHGEGSLSGAPGWAAWVRNLTQERVERDEAIVIRELVNPGARLAHPE